MPITKASQITPMHAVRAGMVFLRDNWISLLPALILYALANAYANALDLTEADAGPLFRGLLVAMLLSLSLTAAALRKAIRDESSGFLHLDFGRDELRLLGASMIFFFGVMAFGSVALVLAIFLIASTGVMSDPEHMEEALNQLAESGDSATVMAGLLILAGLAIMTWAGTRLSLYSACTVGLRRVSIIESWKWSRGHVWLLLGSHFLMLLVFLLAILLLTIFLGVLFGFDYALQIWEADSSQASLSSSWLFCLPPALMAGFATLVWAGMGGYFYQALNPDACQPPPQGPEG